MVLSHCGPITFFVLVAVENFCRFVIRSGSTARIQRRRRGGTRAEREGRQIQPEGKAPPAFSASSPRQNNTSQYHSSSALQVHIANLFVSAPVPFSSLELLPLPSSSKSRITLHLFVRLPPPLFFPAEHPQTRSVRRTVETELTNLTRKDDDNGHSGVFEIKMEEIDDLYTVCRFSIFGFSLDYLSLQISNKGSRRSLSAIAPARRHLLTTVR
uniref:Uncharacterized protein n=1 Tax=Globodera rostochiensis TaxID=31243 RepID=A0A914GXT7_GLORO